MEVKIVIGPRDEEKIKMVKNARKTLSESEWNQFVFECMNSDEQSEWYDAFYYANKYGDGVLVEESNYCYDLAIENPCVADYYFIDV